MFKFMHVLSSQVEARCARVCLMSWRVTVLAAEVLMLVVLLCNGAVVAYIGIHIFSEVSKGYLTPSDDQDDHESKIARVGRAKWHKWRNWKDIGKGFFRLVFTRVIVEFHYHRSLADRYSIRFLARVATQSHT